MYEQNKKSIYKWREAHKEEYLAQCRRYYAVRKEKIKEARRRARLDNLEEARAYGRRAFRKHYDLKRQNPGVTE